MLATTDGRVKRVAFKEFPVQGRAGKGVVSAKLVRDATVADAVLAEPDNTIVYVTLKGNAKSLKAKNLTRRGRPAGGDEAIALKGGALCRVFSTMNQSASLSISWLPRLTTL